jgi:hypothetical protein
MVNSLIVFGAEILMFLAVLGRLFLKNEGMGIADPRDGSTQVGTRTVP